MEGESAEFHDWELLHHNSDPNSNTVLVVEENLRDFQEEEEGIEGDSEGMIRSDYFSIDSHSRYAKTVSGGDTSEEGSVESDNPSWIDPGSENRYGVKNSGEFWSDSSSDKSDERKFGDIDAKHELGTVETVKSQVGVEGVGELGAGDANLGKLESVECKYSGLDVNSELGFVENEKSDVGFEGFGEISKESEMGLELSGGFESGNGSNVESGVGDEHSEESEDGAIVEMKSDVKSVGVGEKRRVVWWKVPLEFLKYCAFRVSPVWSFSVAAALMGFIILGRRLSKMKRKSQSLQLKIAVDDKKVSQFRSRAARLNEAFSVVRRVPIIRPSHPAAGLTSWPVMSLR